MASTIFPQPSSSAAFGLSMAAANTIYQANCNLTPGVYTLSVAAGVTVTIDMFSANSYITTQSGTTGLSFNLTQSIDRVVFYASTGTNQVANITLTATVLPIVSGTVTSYTTSQTVTGLSGLGYVVCYGGGGSGGNFSQQIFTGRYTAFSVLGGGGAAGGIGTGRIALTSSMALVIGAGGLGQASGSNTTSPGLPGGSTTFGGITGSGGGGGAGGGGGVGGGSGSAGGTTGPSLPFSGITGAGTIGSGGGAGYNSGGGGGSGTLGSGGSGATQINSTAANSATGRASGGGGSGSSGTSGAGTAGAVYVLQYA
jgi:hypothetical protein